MDSSPRLLLAPGASGKVEKLHPLLRALRTRGIQGTTVALPRGPAQRALPAWRAAVASAGDGDAVFIGGQSFGGRVASLLAAELPASTEPAVAGLVLMCFPLHPPGRPERAAERTAHFESISFPVLLLSGESDPFAQLPLLRRAAGRLPHAELVTYPKVGHSLAPVLADAADRIAAFVASHRHRSVAAASSE
jgi:predicted alpha/beta-hydrolase family hydrolase